MTNQAIALRTNNDTSLDAVSLLSAVAAYIALGFNIPATMGLLSFLHGKEGTITTDRRPEWVGSLERVYLVTIDWPKGRVTEEGREMKLGKWLRKGGKCSPEQIKQFETREELTYNWRISTDIEDVLGMSHNRAWTSCMRPGEDYAEGPLAEWEAGAAVVLYYRPGADQPCGRELLRPVAWSTEISEDVWEPSPGIVRSQAIYGNGCSIPHSEISKEIYIERGVMSGHCCWCEGGYDDVAQDDCPEDEDKPDTRKRLKEAFKNVMV